NYRRAPGEWLPDPFLRFRIPINGLVAGAGGVPLARGDSVRITLTIDSVLLNVDFQPSGVVFSKSSPAQLAIWYKSAKADPWRQLWSKNDVTLELVTVALHHFSQYSVAW